MKNKLENFVPFPRSILNDLQNGLLNRNEYDLLMFVRHHADICANVLVSLDGLASDFTHRKWKKNYVNQLLLSLKGKSYLYYPSRAGHRGSFKIHFPDFKLGNGKITTVKDAEQSKGGIHMDSNSEVAERSGTSTQSFGELKQRSQGLVKKMSLSSDRGNYSDNETEKEKISFPLKSTKVSEFVPKTYEEERCREIAIALEEQDMRFLLGTLKAHRFQVIEESWREYQEADKTKIRNKGGFFNSLIQKRVAPKDNSP